MVLQTQNKTKLQWSKIEWKVGGNNWNAWNQQIFSFVFTANIVASITFGINFLMESLVPLHNLGRSKFRSSMISEPTIIICAVTFQMAPKNLRTRLDNNWQPVSIDLYFVDTPEILNCMRLMILLIHYSWVQILPIRKVTRGSWNHLFNILYWRLHLTNVWRIHRLLLDRLKMFRHPFLKIAWRTF